VCAAGAAGRARAAVRAEAVRRSPAGLGAVSANVLSQRLRELEDHRILKRAKWARRCAYTSTSSPLGATIWSQCRYIWAAGVCGQPARE
jgi:DNA-binding HxlR family transcriptional regulator